MKPSPMSPKPPADPSKTWEEEIADVKPLGAKSTSTPHQPKPKPPLRPYAHHTAAAGWSDTPPIPVSLNTAECIMGQAPHLEKQVMKDLSAGKIRPSAVIDLHGLGEGDAWLHLTDFIHAAADNDHRCALVIHGKGVGFGPKRDMGIIKFQIGAWLGGHPKVLAFHTAIPQDGGNGAIYVYLRRRR